jgi:hypothetical protein
LQVECQRFHGLVCTVVYAPDDRVTAISIFNDCAGAEESNRRALAWIGQTLRPLLTEPATAMAARDRAHLGVADAKNRRYGKSNADTDQSVVWRMSHVTALDPSSGR